MSCPKIRCESVCEPEIPWANTSTKVELCESDESLSSLDHDRQPTAIENNAGLDGGESASCEAQESPSPPKRTRPPAKKSAADATKPRKQTKKKSPPADNRDGAKYQVVPIAGLPSDAPGEAKTDPVTRLVQILITITRISKQQEAVASQKMHRDTDHAEVITRQALNNNEKVEKHATVFKPLLTILRNIFLLKDETVCEHYQEAINEKITVYNSSGLTQDLITRMTRMTFFSGWFFSQKIFDLICKVYVAVRLEEEPDASNDALMVKVIWFYDYISRKRYLSEIDAVTNARSAGPVKGNQALEAAKKALATVQSRLANETASMISLAISDLPRLIPGLEALRSRNPRNHYLAQPEYQPQVEKKHKLGDSVIVKLLDDYWKLNRSCTSCSNSDTYGMWYEYLAKDMLGKRAPQSPLCPEPTKSQDVTEFVDDPVKMFDKIPETEIYRDLEDTISTFSA